MSRMLIVNTRHYFGGGDSTYAFNLADLLRKNGHSVSFFAMRDQRNISDLNEDLFVDYIDYRELNQKKNLLNGLKVLSRSVYSLEARRKFALLLDREEPDLIHLQNIHAHITPSVIFEAKKKGIPVVWTLHDYKLVCPNSHFLIDQTREICEDCRGGRFYHAVLRRCKKNSILSSTMAAFEAYVHRFSHVLDLVDAFLCPSLFLKEKLLENGFPENKVFHLPLFLPDDAFSPSKNNASYFLFLGRLERIKGIEILVEAARLIPEVNVILAGRIDDAMEKTFLQDLPANMKYVGYKSGKDLDTLKKNALAFLVPSVWYENQPFSILEAFALGKPVIASDLGGMSELVKDKERGFLVKPSDHVDLAEKMELLGNSEANIKKMGACALDYVKNNHSSAAHYQRLMMIFSDISS